MFSQYTKDLLNRNRESISSGSSQEPGISLFYSVPTLPAEAEIRESISLQTSQVHYHQYDDDDEYQESEPDPALLTTVPLSTHQTTQTAAEIYRDVPSSIATRISSNTMSDGLLPSSSIPPPLLSGLSHRKFKDPVFAVLFITGLIAMTIIGIILLFTTNSYPFKDHTKSVFFVIRDSAWPIFFSITFSLCSSFVWLFFLRSFVQPLVWGTLISVPFVFTAMFIWAFVSSLTGPLRESGKPDPQDNLLLTLSFIPFFISLGSVVFLYTRRKNVKKTINIIELACEILNANRRMVNVSLIILGAYIIFTIIWLIFFSRVFLYGHMVQTSTSTWMFYQNSYLLLFFVFMYLWTSAVLYNIQRVTLAGVVSDWYFYRRELDRDASQDTSSLALRRATTSSLGSVCLGGLILSTVRFLHFINEFTKKNIKRGSIFYCMTTCFACLDGIISVLDKYTLIYVGISGESYFSSAVFTAKLFRRNLVFGLVNDTITNIILWIGTIMISLFCGFATFIYATHSLQSSYGYVVGILASIIPYYISQFFVCIMMDIVDATFLCYAIDLDTNKIHCTKAHEAFSNFQIQ